MKSKEIWKQMVAMAIAGKSRQEIYDAFNSKIKGRELDLARIVADVPTLAKRKHWQHHNTVLAGLMAACTMIKFLYVFRMFGDYPQRPRPSYLFHSGSFCFHWLHGNRFLRT
jgi:hypothetical protein